MTEKEKMLVGMVYDATTPELIAELQNTREILYEFNMLRPSESQRMKEILKGLLGHTGDDHFLINQPFRCDYGKQISIGKRFFVFFVHFLRAFLRAFQAQLCCLSQAPARR